MTFGELSAVDESSSLDESNIIRATATSAPPTPIPNAVDMVMALDVAADEDTILDSISSFIN